MDELTRKFIDEGFDEIRENGESIHTLRQTVYGETGTNGLKGDVKDILKKLSGVDFAEIKNYSTRITSVEGYVTAQQATAKWRMWVVGIIGSIMGSIVTAIMLKIIFN